jgi:hypothetical protein
MSSLVLGSTCNPSEICTVDPASYNLLQEQYTSLNNLYNGLLEDNKNLNDTISILKLELANITSERDYYKFQYENGSLGKISVKDFYLNIDNIINNYNQTIINFYITIAIVFVLEIGLFSFALIKMKNNFKAITHKYEQSVTKINSIIASETNNSITVHESNKSKKSI